MYFANALAPAFERKATAGMFRILSFPRKRESRVCVG